jgi:hypothetical protein
MLCYKLFDKTSDERKSLLASQVSVSIKSSLTFVATKRKQDKSIQVVFALNSKSSSLSLTWKSGSSQGYLSFSQEF